MPKKKKKTTATVLKVKHSKEWLRRSKAAKKGWITRKKRELPKKIAKERELISNGLQSLKIKPKTNPRIEKELKTVAELEKKLAIETKKRKALETKIENKINKIKEVVEERNLATRERDVATQERDLLEYLNTFVEDLEPEQLRENWTIAYKPSRLRHLPETQDLKNVLNKASGGHFGEYDLSKTDARRLHRKATELSLEYNVPIREVYTLFYSP